MGRYDVSRAIIIVRTRLKGLANLLEGKLDELKGHLKEKTRTNQTKTSDRIDQ